MRYLCRFVIIQCLSYFHKDYSCYEQWSNSPDFPTFSAISTQTLSLILWFLYWGWDSSHNEGWQATSSTRTSSSSTEKGGMVVYINDRKRLRLYSLSNRASIWICVWRNGRSKQNSPIGIHWTSALRLTHQTHQAKYTFRQMVENSEDSRAWAREQVMSLRT